MTKLQQYLTNMRAKQESFFFKLNSGPTFLYFIIILLFGEIFYLVNELNQSRGDYAQLRTITDDLSLQVEKLKQVDISVAEETPPRNIPWKKIIGISSSVIAAVFLFKYLGGIDPTPVGESINSLRTVMPSFIDSPKEESYSIFESMGTLIKLNSLKNDLQSIKKCLGPLNANLGDLLHKVTFLSEENETASKAFMEALSQR